MKYFLRFTCAGILMFSTAVSGAESASGQIIDYSLYGNMKGIGTDTFSYEVTDGTGLGKAVGKGVYPNTEREQDSDYLEFLKRNPGGKGVWSHLNDPDAELYIASSTELSPGQKQYMLAEIYTQQGNYDRAVRAYYSIVLHFPRTVIWSRDQSFYWHVAPEAIARIRKICAEHPELGYRLEDAFVEAAPSDEKNPDKDVVKVWPGAFRIGAPSLDPAKKDVILEKRGGSHTELIKDGNGQWRLSVEGKPFVIKGVSYRCSKVGETPHDGSLRPWMNIDDNHNGINDCMFESWIDSNGNNKQDENEKVTGDAALLKEAGINTIRYYHTTDSTGVYDPGKYDKPVMRKLYKDYGIRFVMGDFIGAYTIGSGASWNAGTDYRNPTQRKKMMDSVLAMVRDHKDEPYVLLWLLGNENQHASTHTNANLYPKEYAEFINEVAAAIKQTDNTRPVAVCNLNAEGVAALSAYAPEVDIYGANVYSGAYCMGSVYQKVKRYYDRPLMFTEWGSDAYFNGKGPDEAAQAEYIRLNWKDIQLNMADALGEGNVIGGIVFEWMDEWWKSWKDTPKSQSTAGDMMFPFADGWSNEEWYGITGQGDGSHSPYMRVIRKAYRQIKEMWAESPYLYLAGDVELINHTTGEFVVMAVESDEWTDDFSGKLYKLKVDPASVEISNTHNQDLVFADLKAGDSVDVDIRKDDYYVEEIFLNGFKQGVEER